MARKMCSFCGKRDRKRRLENYIGNGLFHEECFELHIAYVMRFEDGMDLFRREAKRLTVWFYKEEYPPCPTCGGEPDPEGIHICPTCATGNVLDAS